MDLWWTWRGTATAARAERGRRLIWRLAWTPWDAACSCSFWRRFGKNSESHKSSVNPLKNAPWTGRNWSLLVRSCLYFKAFSLFSTLLFAKSPKTSHVCLRLFLPSSFAAHSASKNAIEFLLALIYKNFLHIWNI